MWILLYKATRDGFRAQDLHRLSNGQTQTMSIIKTEQDHLFGGYASVAWSSAETYISDPQAFIFTLTNPNSISPTRYLINTLLKQYAFYHGVSYGPTFGGGHGIYVRSCSNSAGSYFNFPHSYMDTTGLGSETFTGNRTFTATEIEVYKLVGWRHNRTEFDLSSMRNQCF